MVDMGENIHLLESGSSFQQAYYYYWGSRGLVQSPFLMARQCNLGSQEVKHEFPYLPDCPVGQMARDLLCKLRTHITFDSEVEKT
jgi:hypothetical protein